MSAADLFDCDGTKGINAIVFDVSAEWCAACVSEASDFKMLIPQYQMLGVKAVTLMVEANGADVQPTNVKIERASLEDVFLKLTGEEIRD